MKKTLLKINGANAIEKSSQKLINGGFPKIGCPTGCFDIYECPGGGVGNGHLCGVASPSGGECFGTLQNGQCCVSGSLG